MVKTAIILLRHQMSPEDQHDWWINHHAPIARRIPGLRSYTIKLSDKDENGQDPAIAGADLEFDDWEAAQAAYESMEWQAAREDTAASGARTLRTWIQETVRVPLH